MAVEIGSLIINTRFPSGDDAESGSAVHVKHDDLRLLQEQMREETREMIEGALRRMRER